MCVLLDSLGWGSVIDFKGSEVTAEVRSESVLRWLLQEGGTFSPGIPLTACGIRMVPLSQVVRDRSSGGEELEMG